MRVVAVSLLLAAAAVHAEDRVPEKLGLMVMLKIVSYDAAFASRGSGDFVVLVPYAPGDEARAHTIAAVGAALEVKTIKERSLRFVPVPVGELSVKKGSAVLLHLGARGEVLKASLARAREEKLYVLTLEEALVKEGALLGVGLNNGKPQPLINVAAMKALGADFGTVLRLARTFQ